MASNASIVGNGWVCQTSQVIVIVFALAEAIETLAVDVSSLIGPKGNTEIPKGVTKPQLITLAKVIETLIVDVSILIIPKGNKGIPKGVTKFQ